MQIFIKVVAMMRVRSFIVPKGAQARGQMGLIFRSVHNEAVNLSDTVKPAVGFIGLGTMFSAIRSK